MELSSGSQLQIPSFSLRNKLIILLLFSLLVAAITTIVLSVDSAMVSRKRAQAESYAQELTYQMADRNTVIFTQIIAEAQKLAVYTASVYDNELLATDDFWNQVTHMQYKAGGQYANNEQDISSVFVPAEKIDAVTLKVDSKTKRDLQLSAYLDLTWPASFRTLPYATSIVFGTPNLLFRHYPNINTASVLSPDYRTVQQDWYSMAVQNNPQRESKWFIADEDLTAQGLVATISVPVYNQTGELVGVSAIHIKLQGITKELLHPIESGYFFLIDNTSGEIIFLPEQGCLELLSTSCLERRSMNITKALPIFSPILAEMQAGLRGFKTITNNGREVMIAYAQLPGPNWSLGSIVNTNTVLQAIPGLHPENQGYILWIALIRTLPISMAILALTFTLGLWYLRTTITPLEKLALAARLSARGNLEAILFPATRGDEIEVIGDALKALVGQVREGTSQLQQRVNSHLRDMLRNTTQLKTVSEIAREAANIKNLDIFLSRAAQLIQDRFGYYFTGVFLLDDQKLNAVLRAATGEAGTAMLQSGFKLKMNDVGIVTSAANFGDVRVINDVQADFSYVKHPLLPTTRSEAAIPLKLGGNILGILDIQSNKAGVLTGEEMAALQIVADQLAVVVQSDQRLRQLQTSLQEASVIYQRITSESWSHTALQGRTTGFEYDLSTIVPAQRQLPAGMLAQLQSGKASIQQVSADGKAGEQSLLVAPLMVYGQLIGVVGMEEVAPNHQWSADEVALIEAIANQASLALDNARLLEETQTRASRERLVAEITNRVRSSPDFDAVVRSAVRELSTALGRTAFVRVGSAEELSQQPVSVEIGHQQNISGEGDK